MTRLQLVGACGSLLASLSLFAGCAVRTPEIHFDDSHQLFLESTIDDLGVAGAVSQQLPKGATVCVVSIESDKTGDSPLIAVIEDNLVSDLLGAGFTVLERDDDLVKRIIQESAEDNYQYALFPGRVEYASSSVSGYRGYLDSGLAGSAGAAVLQGSTADTVLTVSTNMTKADYVIAYRVLECGLVYRSVEKEDMKTREAQVRLHVRVHDAQTGQVVLATMVESRKEDLVDLEAAPWLSNYHYSFFGADYPNQRGVDERQKTVRGHSATSSSTGGDLR